ncbi:hypothetical protein LUZ60_017148 [Juncus effusus]|nr:hypothetical protein LUZ60_017148 [Juncus effusus]
MAGQSDTAQSSESFEYMLFEGDPDQLRPVFSTPNQISPWIDPTVLNLKHRIGRGNFGDVWIATHHLKDLDDNRYHEVAVKMLYPIKEDQLSNFLSRFDDLFSKIQGLDSVCFLHGISILNGRVCIVMKFYEGSVGDKMARLKGGKLPLSDVLRYGADIAQAITDLHARGILVLNTKPFNFLLSDTDKAILGDLGFPSLLFNLSLPNPNSIHRLGSPNYMAPEQFQPQIRGPIGFESDSWGFACAILEMFSGAQCWRGKSFEEIFEAVVIRREKPILPDGLPVEVRDVIWGCFECDLRFRPLMTDVLKAFNRHKNTDFSTSTFTDPDSQNLARSARGARTDWSLLKDKLQMGDTVRSRKSRNSCSRTESMHIPEGSIVGQEEEEDLQGHCFFLVRVHGIHDPLRVHSSSIERVSFGFAVGDWVRLRNESGSSSRVGILHGVSRDGFVEVGLIGMENLWKGSYTEIQMAESFCVGQFVRVRGTVANPRFDWPRKKDFGSGVYDAGRVSFIYPNGCLEVRFPGRFSFKGDSVCLADPSEVETVNFEKCEGLVKKYQHLEDFHWAVRPLVIALGIFSVFKMGRFVVKRVSGKKRRAVSCETGGEQQTGADGQNAAWLPPSVANILFTAPSR